MRIISRTEIEANIDLTEMAQAIEAAYRASSEGRVELPPVGHITFPDVDGDCHIKYGHQRGDANFVIKVAAGFPQQAALGEPTGNGLSLAISATTGAVEAVLHDEMLLTDVRTGVGGAIASRLLARPDAANLLIVGTGVQARHQIAAHLALLPHTLNVTIWGRNTDSAQPVADEVECNVAVATDLEAACRTADIIVTTTAATSPLIQSEWIQLGTHITAVGADAPGKHELDPDLLARADVLIADSRTQCLHHGELSAARDRKSVVVELGELLTGDVVGRQTPTQISIADLTGIAAQDIAAANTILNRLTEAD